MRRLSFVILLTLCLILLIACGSNEEKTYITFGEAGVLSAQIETTEAGSMRVPSPAGISAGSCVGWQAKTEDGTVFLQIGATYTYEAGENKSFTPVYLNLKTEDATLVLDGVNAGIRFTTKVKKAEWETLTSCVAEITRGTLIFTASDISSTNGTLTHAALEQVGKTPLDVPTADLHTTTAEVCFAGTLTDISELFGSRSYTAVGYVKITYNDGSVAYIYANSKGNSASLISLARAALVDLSDTQKDAYQYPAGDKFSPYTGEQQAKLAELSKFSVLLAIDATVKGNRRLHDDSDVNLYAARMIYFADDSNASGKFEYTEEAQAIYRALRNNKYAGGGALIIAAKDGTDLSAENMGKISIIAGANVVEITTYIFYNGSLVIPYKVYTDSY